MRQLHLATFLFAFLLSELPLSAAQQADAADDDDDSDDGDAGVENAVKLAEKMGNQIATDFAGPAMPAQQVQPAAPAVEEPKVPAAPAVEEPKVPEVPAEAIGPATVNMVSSLNRFGKKHSSETTEQEAQVEADAVNAHKAAESAKTAAAVASKVAKHSVHITHHAQSALKDAREALHNARVDTKGLSAGQKESLKAAEAKLKEATKKAEYGEVKNAKYVKVDAKNEKLQKLEKKMEKVKKAEKVKKSEQKVQKFGSQVAQDTKNTDKKDGELEAMRKEVGELREQLKTKEGEKADDDAALKELQDQIKQMEEEDKKEDKGTKESHDEMKAEIERLREEIKSMKEDKADEGKVEYKVPEKKKDPVRQDWEEVGKYDVKMKPLKEDKEQESNEAEEADQTVTPVEEKGIDIDTAMPYGDLEPFGREDTAQELTESSIKESDAMVDQLERAEVSEEKRAVFRALTRLRGAAITSFDGVARSQTGNIDEYNKIHKWRETHPLHHLADEESDVSKWAFPENAD